MSNEVTVIEKEIEVTYVDVGVPGPRGVSGSVYEHMQPIASASWTVNHNLGYRPNTDAYSVGGVKMLAEVIHLNTNQVMILFDGLVSGFAICS